MYYQPMEYLLINSDFTSHFLASNADSFEKILMDYTDVRYTIQITSFTLRMPNLTKCFLHSAECSNETK